MYRFKFTPDDLFVNRLKTYPRYNIFIYQGSININRQSGSGGPGPYDINRNRVSNFIQPYVEHSPSKKTAFKIQQHQPLVENHSGDFQWTTAYTSTNPISTVSLNFPTFAELTPVSINGESSAITSSYGTESPITRNLVSRTAGTVVDFYDTSQASIQLAAPVSFATPLNTISSALQNVAKKYTTLSDHFIFASSSIRGRDLVSGSAANNINFIFIPSMYYGSSIKKGSVELDYYIRGSKIASCADVRHNGTLIGTTGSTSGSVVGLVMYDEGIIMLTSSVNLETGPALNIEYDGTTVQESSWRYFGTTLNDGIDPSSTNLNLSSFNLNFKGTSYVNTMTMFAHARKGHLNHSNNPTYRDLEYTRQYNTGSGISYYEGESQIANIVSASYMSASFEKTTYISKVHIYDEDGNLIGITSMAKPVKKTLNDEFTFKMKLDL